MDAMWPTGSAYINGRFMPVGEAMIPVNGATGAPT